MRDWQVNVLLGAAIFNALTTGGIYDRLGSIQKKMNGKAPTFARGQEERE